MTLETIQRLLQDVPHEASSLHWVQQQPPKDFALETLQEYPYQVHLGALLGTVPPALLLQTFEKDFLVWLWLHAPYERQDDIIRAYADATNNDWILFNTIRKAFQQEAVPQDPRILRKTYQMITTLNDAVANTEARITPQQFAPLDFRDSSAYRIISVCTKSDEIWAYAKGWHHILGKTERERISIPLEIIMGIALLYNNIPQAVCSFFPRDLETLIIYQFQGIYYEQADARGHFPKGDDRKIKGRAPQRLSALEWRGLFVSSVQDIALQNDFSRLAIRSGKWNPMTRKKYKDTGEIHLPLERALQIYDRTAARLGFAQEKDENWYKEISR